MKKNFKSLLLLSVAATLAGCNANSRNAYEVDWATCYYAVQGVESLLGLKTPNIEGHFIGYSEEQRNDFYKSLDRLSIDYAINFDDMSFSIHLDETVQNDDFKDDSKDEEYVLIQNYYGYYDSKYGFVFVCNALKNGIETENHASIATNQSIYEEYYSNSKQISFMDLVKGRMLDCLSFYLDFSTLFGYRHYNDNYYFEEHATSYNKKCLVSEDPGYVEYSFDFVDETTEFDGGIFKGKSAGESYSLIDNFVLNEGYYHERRDGTFIVFPEEVEAEGYSILNYDVKNEIKDVEVERPNLADFNVIL